MSLTSVYCFCEANSSVKDPCLWKRPTVWKASQLSLRGGADKDHCLLNNNNNSILIRSFETVSPGVVEARSPGAQKLLIKASLQRIRVLNLRRKNASFLKMCFFIFWPYCKVCGILVLWPGIELTPLCWKYGLLTPGPPGKFCFKKKSLFFLRQIYIFNSTWTEKFQMCKLCLEKTEEPEIRLPTSTRS